MSDPEIVNSDSVGFVLLLVIAALILCVTVASVGWRLSGHGPVLPLHPDPVTIATAPEAVPVPYQEKTP